ncbi:MAG TPA: hypothetical protein VIG33_12550 [Pseudobdellovibrionaceae bacterium]|jgi:hypothetical protein
MGSFVERTALSKAVIFSFIFTPFLFGQIVQAEDLSEVALFHRCYSQLTSQRVATTDPLFQQVKSGKLTAIDACNQVLDSAKLSGSSAMTLANPNDVRAQNVLATFHRLHASWFYAKDFPVISWPGHSDDMKDLYDSSSPALYYTRALFGNGISASDPVMTPDFLQAIRTNMSPSAGPESNHSTSDYIFQTPFKFAATGTLLGIQIAPSTVLNFPAFKNHPAGSIDLYSNRGGGFLGTMTYLNLNISSISSYSPYKTDGAVQMHRRWGKAVYRDTLCRDLPVVREADVAALVQTSSPVSFRTSNSCVKCHASHDRISGVVRGMNILYVGTGDPTGNGTAERGGNFSQFYPVTKSAEAAWPASPDADYYQRPPNGQVYFRNYNGDLIDQSVTGVNDLGAKLAATDDYYICLAKRYYNYFLGIDVDTGDLNDPAHPVALSPAALIHRNLVINLGKSVKSSQNISQLIKDILKLSNYRKVDIGISGATNGP